MSASRPEVAYKGTPFAEAVDHLRNKLRLSTQHYTDLIGAAHCRAFVVAGAMQDDMLAGMQESIARCLSGGGTLADFRRDFDRLVAAHGWSYRGERGWRTATIYNTNIRTSLMAGKWQQAQSAKRLRPYGRYTHTPSNHPRVQHMAWDGKIVPLDDPWWDTHWPPNGWRCRCGVQTMSAREVERDGAEVWTPPADQPRRVAMRTPDGLVEVDTVEGVEPGWAYNVGKSATGLRLGPAKVVEAQADGTWRNWRRIPFGRSSEQTWETLGLPARLPIDSVKAKLAQKAATKDGLGIVARKMLGGEEAYLPTADGGYALLTLEGLLHIQPGRSPFVPIIPELLSAPCEVWMTVEQHEVTGRVEIRRRYIKYIEYGGKGQGMYLVAQIVKGQLTGWTFVPASSASVLNRQRVGRLVWARQ